MPHGDWEPIRTGVRRRRQGCGDARPVRLSAAASNASAHRDLRRWHVRKGRPGTWDGVSALCRETGTIRQGGSRAGRASRGRSAPYELRRGGTRSRGPRRAKERAGEQARWREKMTCSDASCVSSRCKSCRWSRPVATVVIPSNAEGDRCVGSLGVKVSFWEASKSAGRSNGEPVSPEIPTWWKAERLSSARRPCRRRELDQAAAKSPGT